MFTKDVASEFTHGFSCSGIVLLISASVINSVTLVSSLSEESSKLGRSNWEGRDTSSGIISSLDSSILVGYQYTWIQLLFPHCLLSEENLNLVLIQEKVLFEIQIPRVFLL